MFRQKAKPAPFFTSLMMELLRNEREPFSWKLSLIVHTLRATGPLLLLLSRMMTVRDAWCSCFIEARACGYSYRHEQIRMELH